MACILGRRCTGTICVRSSRNNCCEDLQQDHCLGGGVGRFISTEPFTGDSVAAMMVPGDVYGQFLPEGFTVKKSLHPYIAVGMVIKSVDGMAMSPAWLALNAAEVEFEPQYQSQSFEVEFYYPGSDPQILTLARA